MFSRSRTWKYGVGAMLALGIAAVNHVWAGQRDDDSNDSCGECRLARSVATWNVETLWVPDDPVAAGEFGLEGVTVGSDGFIYVTVTIANQIYRIDRDGNAEVAWTLDVPATAFSKLRLGQVTFDRAGNGYVGVNPEEFDVTNPDPEALAHLGIYRFEPFGASEKIFGNPQPSYTVVRGGPRNSDRLLRWDPDQGEGVWHATEETELSC